MLHPGAFRSGWLVTSNGDSPPCHQGEMLPMQGGTNEQVVAKMYSELDESVKNNLKVYWYTGA